MLHWLHIGILIHFTKANFVRIKAFYTVHMYVFGMF